MNHLPTLHPQHWSRKWSSDNSRLFFCIIGGATRFTHSGNHGNARYEIELRPYAPNPVDWAEVTKYADEGVKGLLVERSIHLSPHLMTVSDHFLLNDVIFSEANVTESTRGTKESCLIQSALLDSLRLHASAGIGFYATYNFRSPPPIHSGLIIHSPNTHQTIFSHLDGRSELRNTDFDACRVTIDLLIRKIWSEDATLDKVLRLALEYHRLSFTLERVDHSFLVLMVAFEAMFKKEDEKDASKAAKRIGRLLGATKKECGGIQKEFFSNTGNCFCKIRNGIAHGQTSVSLATVASRCPSLYCHVTKAIVKLLNLPSGTLDETKNFYDQISNLTEDRFLSLPNT